MYTTALLFVEEANQQAGDLMNHASTASGSPASIALTIFENLDPDNFDAMQLMTTDLSICRPAELYRRFDHEQRW